MPLAEKAKAFGEGEIAMLGAWLFCLRRERILKQFRVPPRDTANAVSKRSQQTQSGGGRRARSTLACTSVGLRIC